MIKQILVIGDVTIDNQVIIDNASIECDFDHTNCKLCLDYAAKIPISNSFQTIGGNGANVSIGLARLGIDTMLLSSTGNDANREIVLKEIGRAHV